MKQRFMHFKSAFIRDGAMWCVPVTVNWLHKINISNWSVKSVCNLELDERFQIDYIYQHGDSAWCITAVGVRLVRYHMLTGGIEHYEFAGEDKRVNRGAVLFGDKLWILPKDLPGKMISFDLVKKKFTVHDSWGKECLRWKVTGRAVSFCQIENIVYMTVRDECKIIQFDLKDETVKVKHLSGEHGLWCVFTANYHLYATSFVKRMLFRWEEWDEEAEKIYCPYLQDKPYGRGMGFGEKILLMDKETIDVLNPETGRISPFETVQKKLKSADGTSGLLLFFQAITYDNRYLMLPWGADVALEFSEEQKEWTTHEVRIPGDLFQKYVLKKMDESSLIPEGRFLIRDMIDYIGTDYKKPQQMLEGRIGDEIYRRICRD